MEPKAPPPDKSRVFVVEDHPIVRHGLSALIDEEPDLYVCGSAQSAQEALPLIKTLKPDVAVVDISLPDGSGLDLIKDVHEARPDLPMLALSMHDEAVYAERALRAGARGYIMKKEAMDRVMTAIRHVIAGELFVSDKMASRMVNKLINPHGPVASPLEALSDREFEVFNLISQGIGPTEIANKLSLSVKTIETHRERIKEKLGLRSGAELTRFALKWSMDRQ